MASATCCQSSIVFPSHHACRPTTSDAEPNAQSSNRAWFHEFGSTHRRVDDESCKESEPLTLRIGRQDPGSRSGQQQRVRSECPDALGSGDLSKGDIVGVEDEPLSPASSTGAAHASS